MNNSRVFRLFPGAALVSNAAFVFVLFLTFWLLVGPVFGQTTTNTQEQPSSTGTEKAPNEIGPAKSVVSGRAVYDDTNRPVRRARVMLIDVNSKGPERLGRTNGSGEFQIKNVPAGSYFVMIDASGVITPLSFVDLEDAINEKFDVDTIKAHFDEVVVDGLHDVTVKVRARRGGAISGKVTYSDGDPAINVRVNVMRKKDGHIARVITNLNPAAVFGIQTDDRGIYRVAGLPAGEYIVSVAESVDHNDGGGAQGGDYLGMYGGDSLVVTYYQGAAKANDATVIQVNEGQDQNEVNISLIDRVLHSISGKVVTRRDGAPLANAVVSIASKDNAGSNSLFASPTSVATDEQGAFTLNEMPDGVYGLTIQPPGSDDEIDATVDEESQPTPPVKKAKTKKPLTTKRQDVTVAGSDVTNVTVVVTEGANISGRVTVEGDRPLPQGLQIVLKPLDQSPGDYKQQLVQPDGKFMIDGVPSGAFDTDVIFAEGENFYLKSITSSGVDLMSDHLLVPESSEINNISVLIAGDAATLSGKILNPDGEPARAARLVLVPADPRRWRARASYFFGSSSNSGEYSISGAPGDYLIIFLHAGDQPRAIDEAWIRDRAATAQHVMLMPSQRKTMDLTVPTE